MNVSRAKIADYLAGQITTDRQRTITSAAAWLVASRQTRQAPYLARDIAATLASQGYLKATVTTARTLTPDSRKRIGDYLREQTGAREVELETKTDPTLIGGLRLETPTAILDDTIKTKLRKLVC